MQNTSRSRKQPSARESLTGIRLRRPCSLEAGFRASDPDFKESGINAVENLSFFLDEHSLLDDGHLEDASNARASL